MNDYSMSAYELAVSLYAASDNVGIPLHRRPKAIIEAWVRAAQSKIASGTVSMDDIATGTAH
jgi:hypothetical protein